MKFSMPYGGLLEIRSDPELTIDQELKVGSDEEVEGMIWQIYWNDLPLPWFTKTKLQAMAIACGCQFGAYKMMDNSLHNLPVR